MTWRHTWYYCWGYCWSDSWGSSRRLNKNSLSVVTPFRIKPPAAGSEKAEEDTNINNAKHRGGNIFLISILSANFLGIYFTTIISSIILVYTSHLAPAPHIPSLQFPCLYNMAYNHNHPSSMATIEGDIQFGHLRNYNYPVFHYHLQHQ
jgi:hypothetical protein